MTDAFADDDFEFANEDFDGGATKGHPPTPKPSKSSKPKSHPPGSSGITAFISKSAPKALPMAMNFLNLLETIYATSFPFLVKANEVYSEVLKTLEPYGVEEITTCVTGVILMFFGGSFATLTAVYEAIQQGGYNDFKAHMSLLFTEYRNFKRANTTDDHVDADNDGIADVKQISAEQYAVRKSLLALRATNPENINKALNSLYTIFIAVLATLRLKFARTISLGGSIGNQLSQMFDKFILPNLESLTDEDYHKWLPVTGNYLCKFIGVTIAFRIQRILTTFHTALKGGRVLSRGLTKLAERNGMGHWTEGYLDEALSAVLCVAGIVTQLFIWNSIPLPVRLLLFPLYFVEGLLSLFVSIGFSMSSPTTPT